MTSMPILLTSVGIECAAHSLARVRLAYYASPKSCAAQLEFGANVRIIEELRALPCLRVHLTVKCCHRADGSPA